MKERIIGAIVLVVVVVLVVPVFLDGPPDGSEVVTERVLLPGQSDQESRVVVLDRDREQPVPAAALARAEETQPSDETQSRPEADAAEEPATGRPVPEPVIETPPVATQLAAEEPERKPDPKPERQPERAPAPQPATSSTGMWAVQLGSFGNRQNADALAAELRKQGFAAFLSQLPTQSGQLHRVRVGPQKDREAAEAMARRLQNAGRKGQVVPHP